MNKYLLAVILLILTPVLASAYDLKGALINAQSFNAQMQDNLNNIQERDKIYIKANTLMRDIRMYLPHQPLSNNEVEQYRKLRDEFIKIYQGYYSSEEASRKTLIKVGDSDTLLDQINRVKTTCDAIIPKIKFLRTPEGVSALLMDDSYNFSTFNNEPAFIKSAASSIDLEVLAEVLDENMDEFKKLAMQDALREMTRKKNLDFATLDLIDTVTGELINLSKNDLSGERLSKALIRYALVKASTSMILKTEMGQQFCKEGFGTTPSNSNNEPHYYNTCSNLTYLVLEKISTSSSIAEMKDINFRDPDYFTQYAGKKVTLSNELGTEGVLLAFFLTPADIKKVEKLSLELKDEKYKDNIDKIKGNITALKNAANSSSLADISNQLNDLANNMSDLASACKGAPSDTINILDMFSESIKNASTLLGEIDPIITASLGAGQCIEQVYEHRKDLEKNQFDIITKELREELARSSSKHFLNEVIVELFEMARATEEEKPQALLDSTRRLVYAGIDRYVEIPVGNTCDSSKTDDIEKEYELKYCLPGVVAHSVLDNITYQKGDGDEKGKYVFNREQAITPLAQRAGRFGGQRKLVFHLVIGSGSASYKDKLSNGKKWAPLVSEQIGFAYQAPPIWRSRVTPKFGLYTSGLLYRAVYNSVESDHVFMGPFVAFDLYETIQVNIAGIWDPQITTRELAGWSAGIYVPLDKYLAKLASKKKSE